MIEHNPQVEICVLGPLLVRIDGVEQEMSAAMQRRLLVRLAVDLGALVPPDQLVDALWGEHPPATADKNLQVLIGRLRGMLGAHAIATEPGGYRLDPGTCSLDARTFEATCSAAGAAAADERMTTAASEWDAALAMWRGEPCAELDAPWGSALVARLTELRAAATESLFAARVALEPTSELVDAIAAEVAARPARPSLRTLLVRAHVAIGDIDGARASVVAALAFVRDGLGLEPDAALRRLAGELRVHDVEEPDAAAVERRVDDLLVDVPETFAVAELLERAEGACVDPALVLDRVAELVAIGRLERVVHDGTIQFRRVALDAGGPA